MENATSKTVFGFSMKSIKFLSIIPARSGSKGIVGKNTVKLLGKPLLAWSIEASLNAKYISQTIVSSDDKKILDISKKFQAQTLLRPKELANDSSTSQEVVEHCLVSLGEDVKLYDYLVLLQPTSPLRDTKDIDNAIQKLLDSNATALISVFKEDRKILKAFKEDKNGYIQGICNNTYPFTPRQKLPPVYMSNGAIYIVKITEFMKTKQLFSDKTIFYEMSKEKSLDIDTLDDLEEVKRYMEKNKP